MSLSVELNKYVTNITLIGMNLAQFSPEEKEQCFKCLNGYANPTTFVEGIEWIVYRVWNAVKSLFGQSDWQICVRAHVEMFERILDEQIAPLKNQGIPIPNIEEKKKEFPSSANVTLTKSLNFYNCRTIKGLRASDHPVMKKIQKLSDQDLLTFLLEKNPLIEHAIKTDTKIDPTIIDPTIFYT